MKTKQILLITKGHPFEREPFFALFDALPDIEWTHVEQPAAQALFDPEHAAKFDAFVLYDMPGITFTESGPDFTEPDAAFKERFQALVARGQGFVFMHHAIAGWPAWDDYAELIGGRFCYLPQTLRGEAVPDSGYRHSVEHKVRVVAEHPVTAGVAPEFSITDELYLYQVFEKDVQPLLASDYEFTSENFYSAAKAVREHKMFDNEGWEHPNGSNLIGWTRQVGPSPLVYLQCGDDAVAYASPDYQRLLHNAIHWVAEHKG